MANTTEQKRKSAEYMRNYWLNNPDKRNAHKKMVRNNMAERRTILKTLYQEWRSGGCIVCSEKAICCLVAHHINPSNKDFEISIGIKSGKKIDTIIRELEKCVCLCENCHRKCHAGLIRL